jgi:hypothetical protein
MTESLRPGIVILQEERKSRLQARREIMSFRERINRFIAQIEETNDRFRGVSDAILISLG